MTVNDSIDRILQTSLAGTMQERINLCALFSSKLAPEFIGFSLAKNETKKIKKYEKYVLGILSERREYMDDIQGDIYIMIPDCDIDSSIQCIFAQNAIFCLLNCYEFIRSGEDSDLRSVISNYVETIDYFIQEQLGSYSKNNVDELVLSSEIYEVDVNGQFRNFVEAWSNESKVTHLVTQNLAGRPLIERWAH